MLLSILVPFRMVGSAPGGCRKRAEQNDPAALEALLALVEPDERGDPMPPLRWTTKSVGTWLRNLRGGTRCRPRPWRDC